MFEAQVAFYLNQYLGKYLSGLDAESLKISVWAGDVQLRNLSLRPEALADLELPITVKAGLLGKLTLKARGRAGGVEARAGQKGGDEAELRLRGWHGCGACTFL
eukprot:3506-Chlamydomonas_euryale.AAC.6